jgi:hypothetical protein
VNKNSYCRSDLSFKKQTPEEMYYKDSFILKNTSEECSGQNSS